MPVELSYREKDLKVSTIYKGDLVWIEAKMLEVVVKGLLTIVFHLKGETYITKSIDELVKDLTL